MPGNFGPMPGGSTILMQNAGKMVMYADENGKIWRYLYDYDLRWPVEFNPPIDITLHGAPGINGSTRK